jgi:SAM-dependent methyltransferase
MQAYQPGFARIYDQYWGGFSRQVAPLILEYYESKAPRPVKRSLLDLCCGAGHLAEHFLLNGYQVVGIDLSEAMLAHARKRNVASIVAGQARFLQADAAGFTLVEKVSLAVSTFDALNHLDSLDALQNCFRSVYACLLEGGLFVFDLNTRRGLMNNWNSISIQDREELTLINRGVYDEQSGRAYTRLTGFVPDENGLYARFEETVFNTAFDLKDVKSCLVQAGWEDVSCARSTRLDQPLDDPESENRIFFVAWK